MILDGGAAKAALKAVRAGLRIEFGSDPGRINGTYLAYGLVIILILGAPNLLEPIVRIWDPDYSSGFPLVAVFAIFTGGFIICMMLLVLLAALIRSDKHPPSSPTPHRKKRRGRKQ